MPNDQEWAAIVTIVAVLLLIALGGRVSMARRKYAVKPPATAGHPDFERVYRAQMNTLENFVVFLPLLWLATSFYGGSLPPILGAVWIVGRILYAAGYSKAAEKRAAGFAIARVAEAALLAVTVVGLAT